VDGAHQKAEHLTAFATNASALARRSIKVGYDYSNAVRPFVSNEAELRGNG